MNSADRRSWTRIEFVLSSADEGVARLVDRGSDQRPGERHEERRGDALAGDVGDDDARPAGPVAEREHVEEVAPDLARRLVVGRDLEAAKLGRRQRDEAALDSPRQRHLGLEAMGGGTACHVLVGRAGERRERVRQARDHRLDDRAVAAADDPPDRGLARAAADLLDARDRGVVRNRAGRRDEPAVHVLDEDRDPRARGGERVEDRPEPLRRQRVAADDLARDDLAGSDRRRPTVSAQRTGLRTPRWRRRGPRG